MKRRTAEHQPIEVAEIESKILAPEIEAPTAEPEPRSSTEQERAKADEHERTQTGIAEAHEKITHLRPKKETAERPKYAIDTYGDFSDQTDMDGKINLTPDETTIVDTAINGAKIADHWSPPSLLIGQKTATEYDSRARNFSTRTRIVELPNGNRVFMVNNYRLSWIHREMDAFGKWTAGAPMRKAKSEDWKKAYEAKSNVPIIENSDPNTVLVPYIENINANDAIAFNHEIKDFGVMPEIKNYGLDEKLELADKIVDELARVHATGKAWGEAILANMIITKEGRPIIVDPETKFNKNIPLPEQQAHDLADFIHSLVSALRRSEKEIDVKSIVERVIERYPNQAAIDALSKNAKNKSKWYRKLLRPIHELPRLGQNGKDYDAVLKILLER